MGGTGDSYFNGNVGVGVSSPGQSVDVSGNVRATGFIGNGSLLTNLPTAAPAGANTQVQYNDGGAAAGASSMIYDKTSGNVGIGSATPEKKLSVVGDVVVRGEFVVDLQ